MVGGHRTLDTEGAGAQECGVSVCELVWPGMGVLNGCLESLCESESGYSGQAMSAEVGLIHVGWWKYERY